MGTGTGILGICAATRNKTQCVTFADINPDAVSLAGRNFDANEPNVQAEFIVTDLFSNLPRHKRYDLIIFNAPYLRSEGDSADDGRWAGGTDGVELSIRFLNCAKAHLKDTGSIILIASSLSDTNMLLKAIEELSMALQKQIKKHYFFEDILGWLITAPQ